LTNGQERLREVVAPEIRRDPRFMALEDELDDLLHEAR
jgi:hypothetical protein